MIFKHNRLTIPSNAEFSVPQLRMMIKETENIIDKKISFEEWNH